MSNDSLLVIFSFAAISAYGVRAFKRKGPRELGLIWPPLLCLLSLPLAAVFDLAPGSSCFAVVVLFMIMPPIFVRQAARALRHGQLRRAKTAMALALVLRPTKSTRRVWRSLHRLCKLALGQETLPALLRETRQLQPDWALHQELLLLGHSYRVEALHDLATAHRSEVLASPFVASAIAASGEMVGPAAAMATFEAATQVAPLQSASANNIWTVLLTAAHVGLVKQVRHYAGLLRHHLAPGRLLHAEIVARQRAGQHAEAALLLEQAAPPKNYRAACELNYRRCHPLEPMAEVPREFANQLQHRLHAFYRETRIREALRTPGWLTLLIGVSLVLGFAWQHHQGLAHWGHAHGAVAPWSSHVPWWRYLSYGWGHVDVGHLCLNLTGLVYFGFMVENLCGKGRLWLVYLGGVWVGGYTFAFSHASHSIALGASGGVMALFGATIAYLLASPTHRKTKEGHRHLRLMALLVVCQAVSEFITASSAASAHIGGCAWGFVTSLVATGLNSRESADSPPEAPARLAG